VRVGEPSRGRAKERESEGERARKRERERERERANETCQPSMIGMLQSMSTRSYSISLVIVTWPGGRGVT